VPNNHHQNSQNERRSQARDDLIDSWPATAAGGTLAWGCGQREESYRCALADRSEESLQRLHERADGLQHLHRIQRKTAALVVVIAVVVAVVVAVLIAVVVAVLIAVLIAATIAFATAIALREVHLETDLTHSRRFEHKSRCLPGLAEALVDRSQQCLHLLVGRPRCLDQGRRVFLACVGLGELLPLLDLQLVNLAFVLQRPATSSARQTWSHGACAPGFLLIAKRRSRES
jgi:hypothetical protein